MGTAVRATPTRKKQYLMSHMARYYKAASKKESLSSGKGNSAGKRQAGVIAGIAASLQPKDEPVSARRRSITQSKFVSFKASLLMFYFTCQIMR